MKKAIAIIGVVNLLRLLLIPVIYKFPDAFQTIFSSLLESNNETVMGFLFGLSNQLLGQSIIAIQLLFFLVSVLTQWALIIFINKIIRSERNHKAWLAIASTLLITFLTVFPWADTLVCMFWIMSLIAFYNAIFENDKKSWLLAGMFMGITNLIKLSGVALPIGLLVFLIFSSRFRYHLFKPGPYIALIMASIITLPIWLGIMQTESSHAAINFVKGYSSILGFRFNSFTTFILFQFVFVLPIIYAGMWWVTFKYLARIFDKPNQVNAEFWFLLSFFLPLFLGFHLTAMFDWVDMLGLAPIYLTGSIVFLKLSKARWFKVNIIFSVLFHLLFFISLLMA